jgi:hypothetical protein
MCKKAIVVPRKIRIVGILPPRRMKFDIFTQWVQVLHEQSLANSSLVKSTGKTGNLRSEAGWSEIAGSVLSPEKCIVAVRKDKFRK